MSDDGYFIVRSGEDGTDIVGPLTEAQVLERITPSPKHGDTYYGTNLSILDQIPDSDKGCWMTRHDNPMVIIKGRIIVPKAKQVATEYEL